MVDELDKLDRRPLYTQVADSISAMIAESELKPGDELPSEAELCARAGVSRVVVRGALAQLAGAGLIKISNGRKPQVMSMDSDVLTTSLSHGLATSQFTVSKVLEVRTSIETGTAALAAQKSSDNMNQRLLALCNQMEKAVGDPESFAELDYRFHLAIAEATDNPLYVYIVKSLRDIIKSSVTAGRLAQSSQRDQNRILSDHHAIQRAIASGSAKAAVDAMQDHFRAANLALSLDRTSGKSGTAQ